MEPAFWFPPAILSEAVQSRTRLTSGCHWALHDVPLSLSPSNTVSLTAEWSCSIGAGIFGIMVSILTSLMSFLLLNLTDMIESRLLKAEASESQVGANVQWNLHWSITWKTYQRILPLFTTLMFITKMSWICELACHSCSNVAVSAEKSATDDWVSIFVHVSQWSPSWPSLRSSSEVQKLAFFSY